MNKLRTHSIEHKAVGQKEAQPLGDLLAPVFVDSDIDRRAGDLARAEAGDFPGALGVDLAGEATMGVEEGRCSTV